MANDVVFEGKERRMPKIEKCLADNGIESLEAARDLCLSKGIDVESIVKGVQPIAFDNAVWAYTLGVALAIKSGVKTASEASAVIGQGLQAFCVPGSVAEQRNVGLGHGNLGARLLHEDTKCFAFLAGHESFAAAEGAIGIAKTANKVRKTPLRVILNGLGKDAAMIISRINGFTYVQTDYDFYTGELKVVNETKYSDGERAAVKCYGANDVLEGVAIMKKEGVDVSITGNSTNPTRFQHLVAGTYKKWANENGVKYFSVASGGGTGMCMAANRFNGIRASVVWDSFEAKMTRNDNDSNVLCLPARVLDDEAELWKDVIDTWLITPFANAPRFRRRNAELDEF